MTLINLRSILLYAVGIATTMLSLNSCSGSSSDPIAVAEQFVTAYSDTDFDKCNSLMFENARNRFVPSSERSEAENMFFKMMQEQIDKMDYKLRLNKEQTEVAEEKADVVFDVTSGADATFSKEFTVRVKKDINSGKWLVDSYDNPF